MALTLSLIGAIITLIFGIWAIIQPVKFSRFISLTPYKQTGITEIRATYGGWVSGLAIFCLWNQSEVAFYTLGCAWFGAALVRIMGIIIDKSYSVKALQLVIGEIIIGLLFFMVHIL